MTKTRALKILALLLVGHAAAAGLFWALINVPESNVAMLLLSVALVVLIVVALSWTETAALMAWTPDVPFGRATRLGLAALPAFLAGLAVFALCWWATARADAWHTAYAGEIDAWWMARTGSASTAWIHSGIAILLSLARYVLGVSLAIAALSAAALRGARGLRSIAWVRAGVSPRLLGPIGLAMVGLILLPLKAVAWRPASIPPTAAEAMFVAAKLGLLYVIINAGWALVLRAGARISASSSPSSLS